MSASAGVMVSLFFVMFMTPVLVSIFPIRAKRVFEHSGEHKKESLLDHMLSWIASFSVHHSGKVLLVSASILIFSLIGVSQVHFSHQPFKWLPENDPSRVATEFVNEHMKGASSAEIIIDSGRENGLYDPRIMEGISQLGPEVETITHKDTFVLFKSVSEI